jgi:hypothetical protein
MITYDGPPAAEEGAAADVLGLFARGHCFQEEAGWFLLFQIPENF